MKNFIKKYFSHFAYFYGFLKHRFIISILLNLVVGLLDGFGLAMFIPLLKMVSGDSEVSGSDLGGLSFMVDGFASLGIPMTLTGVLSLILIFFSLKGVAQFASNYYSLIVRLYFVRTIRFRNVDLLTTFKYKDFVNADAGRIQNTMSGEVGRLTMAYQSYFGAIRNWVMTLVYIGLAFLTNWQFAILVSVGGALSNLIYRQIYMRTKTESLNITRVGHKFQKIMIQMVHFFKYLKATGLLLAYGNKLKSTILEIEKSQKKIGLYSSILFATKEPLMIFVVSAVIYIQVSFLSASLGGIILSLLFFYRALNYVMAIQNSWNSFLTGSGALVNMTEFMDELQEGKEKYGSRAFKEFENKIVIDDVSFYYGETKILNNISYTIKRNTTVAIVGESGSGKTTLVNLLTGLMSVDEGQILIDGLRYRDFDLRTLQKRIGYITQDPVIFSDTIYDNVTQWAPKNEENIAKFWNALEQSAIADFVRSLPAKEDSPMGNNGIQVSGGQKQRISIARELYKEVDLLVMDEATSALDSETERAIQENIEALKGKYTLIIVAHRLSTIKHADEIILLSKGEIKASGDYKELMSISNTFKNMTQLQEI